MPFPFTLHPDSSLRAHRTLTRVVVIALIGLSGTATYAVDEPLTLGQAQQLAVARSRQLTAQDWAITSAQQLAAAAGQLPDPVLKFGVDNLPVDGPERFSVTEDFMTMRRIGVMQEWTRSDKRQLRTERYVREADKSAAEKNVAIAAIERNTALAWLEHYYAQEMAAIAAEQATQARQEIEAAEGAYRAGRGSQAELLSARSALALVDDRSSELGRRLRSATTMLARWIGSAADTPLAGTPAIGTVRLDPATLETQLAHHPQIAVLSRQEAIAQTEAKLAQANKRADWSVEVGFQQRGRAYSNMISVGVSIPLQWDQKNRQDRELSSKLALVERAKAEREETLREHVAETRSELLAWENGLERHTRYEQELIPLAKQRTQATLAAYRGGKSTLADVLAARRIETDMR